MTIIVRKKPGEDEDGLIAEFKKRVFDEKIIDEIKDRQFYKSPATVKKERLAVLRRGKRR